MGTSSLDSVDAKQLQTVVAHVANLVSAFERAEAGTSALDDQVLGMPGMSGRKTRHFLNNLLRMSDARYLEIGMWMGSTTCAAMHGNAARVVGIDNWSQFAGREECLANCLRHRGSNRLDVFDFDCWQFPVKQLGETFNLHLYDGDHSYQSHHLALKHYVDAMDDVFTYMVDDWNWSEVRDGTRAAMRECGLEVVFEHEIRPTQDNTHTPTVEREANWWNGWYAAVVRKRAPTTSDAQETKTRHL